MNVKDKAWEMPLDVRLVKRKSIRSTGVGELWPTDYRR